MTREDPPLRIRLPAELKARVQGAAVANHRSMNAEIVARLEFTFAVDMTVQETGFDVGFGLDSPEMKAALLKQRLGDKATEAPNDLAEIRKELRELRSEINSLKK